MAVAMTPPYKVGNVECQFWADPKRYRCMVWHGKELVKKMVDKNLENLVRRVMLFADTQKECKT